MRVKNKTVIHWPLVAICWGLAIAFVACGVSDGTATEIPATPVPTETVSLRLEDGAVEMQDAKHVWVPIAGETTFDLIGKLENTNPWMVTGNTFAVRGITQVADGLTVGDLVEVKGMVLGDATWLASSITLAKKQTYPTLFLTGKLNSKDPWVISGIKIPVTVGTKITGTVAPGTIVRVEILLFNGGHWDVASLASLSSFTEIPGCSTVTATVVSVKGNEVQFAGWPALMLDKDAKVENEAGTPTVLSANRSVLVVVCPADNGRFMITKIIVLRK